MRRWLLGLLLLALASGGTAQDPQKTPFVEKVEVRVRSVFVFITDAQGKPLAMPPEPKALRVLEDGKPVEVPVEPARRRAAAPAPVPDTPLDPPRRRVYAGTLGSGVFAVALPD
jgi:hypothetical protein